MTRRGVLFQLHSLQQSPVLAIEVFKFIHHDYHPLAQVLQSWSGMVKPIHQLGSFIQPVQNDQSILESTPKPSHPVHYGPGGFDLALCTLHRFH